MRQLYLICLFAAWFGYAMVEARGQSNIGANSKPQLELTTEVVEARYCESDYLRLELRLRYLNIGDQPLILDRQSNVIWSYFISKSIRDAQLKKYEQTYSPSQSRIGPPKSVESEEPDEETFVILKPAAFYEVTATAHFPFIFDGKTEDSDLLRPGRHILEITLQTWFSSQDVAVKLRERWLTHGFLWTEYVVSRPMAFSIAKNPRVEGCSMNLDED